MNSFGGFWSGLWFGFPELGFLWKAMRFSCNCLLKLWISSLVPLHMNLALLLKFYAAGVQSVSYLLKFALSRRALPSVQDSPFDF